jgi:hypothetical protein
MYMENVARRRIARKKGMATRKIDKKYHVTTKRPPKSFNKVHESGWQNDEEDCDRVLEEDLWTMPMTSHECGNWIFCVFVHTHTHIKEMHVRINHSPQKMGRKMPSGNE